MAKKILIAEDDFYIRDVYNKVFSLAGYEVTIAEDGESAVNHIKTTQYDMILLDVMMPKMTGIEVLQTLRDLEPPIKDTPAFIITNLAQQDIVEEAFKIGMDGYIIKSQVSPQQMVIEINNFFANKEKAATETTS